MKYVVILLITLNLLGCNYFDYEKFYSCIESEPVNGRKFSVVVQKNVVKIDGVDKQRCDFEKDTVQFSSDCKNVKIGTFGTLKFITGEFMSSFRESETSIMSNLVTGECVLKEKI